MDSSEPSRKTRAILFSDIQGYSKLMGEDESLGLKLLEEHNAICVPLIKKHGGNVLKFIGDAILASFESASDAVEYGMTVQKLLAERNSSRPDIVPLNLRIGIHIGDVVFKDGDVFGDGVNIAARIEPLAEPGGVAISQTVYDLIKARPEIQTVSLGPRELKNIKDAVNIYQVVIDAQGAGRRSSSGPPAAALALLGMAAIAVAGGLLAKYKLLPVKPEPAPASRAAAQARTPVPAAAPAPAMVAAPTPNPNAVSAEWAKDLQADQRAQADQDKELAAFRKQRDDQWFKELKPLFSSPRSSAADKAKWAQQFYDLYHVKPGFNLGYAAELAGYLPPGPAKAEVEALANSPAAHDQAARMKIKGETGKVLMRLTAGMRFPSEQAHKDFCWNDSPVMKTGTFDEPKEGAPVQDAHGNFTFRYFPKPGVERRFPVSGAVFRGGPESDAEVGRIAEILAKDVLSYTKPR